MKTEEYVYPSTRSKITILSWIAFFGALSYLGKFIQNVDDGFLKEEELESIIFYSYISNSFIFILFLFMSIWLYKQGRTTQKQNRFPPTGFPVLFKTKTSKNKMATLQAIALYLSSILMLSFSLFYIYLIWLTNGT